MRENNIKESKLSKNRYIKYGIYLIIIGICFLPLMVMMGLLNGPGPFIMFQIYLGLFIIPFMSGIGLALAGYIVYIIGNIVGKQPCPVCGAKKLKITGFIKIFCDGCQKEYGLSELAIIADMKK